MACIVYLWSGAYCGGLPLSSGDLLYIDDWLVYLPDDDWVFTSQREKYTSQLSI